MHPEDPTRPPARYLERFETARVAQSLAPRPRVSPTAAAARCARGALWRTFAGAKLLDVDWTLGVTASSSELQAIGSAFVQLRLHVERPDGTAECVHLELSLPRFYELRHELEAAKAQFELSL